AIGRYRPRYLFNDDLFGFEPFGVALKMASLPSGHAQSIWSAMIALAFLTPRYAPVYVAVAVTVSISRFVTAVHFVSDVIVGSFLSIAVAILMRRWFERNNQSIRLTPR
ncbi:MAG: phosphatase PAP2 family protein, partial [Rhodospirillaceae bacterium]|nr:phosphatase PAP2 family protein [Rhodospirillaceae bacterium]